MTTDRAAPARQSIRLPLQIGTSALIALERAALYLVPCSVLAIIAAVPAWYFLRDLGGVLPDVIGKYIFVALVFPAVAFGYAVKRGVENLIDAIRERPSDVIIDGEVLRVSGGPSHGATVELAKAACELGTDDDDAQGEVTQLELAGVGRVATAARTGERRALEALEATIDALGHPDRHAPPERAVEVVTCGTCDAPVVPADAATVACGHCGAQVAIPAEVRERCRALATLRDTRPRNQRRLRSLLRQPRARTANFVIALVGLPMMLIWPAIGFAGYGLFDAGELHFHTTLVLALGALSIVGALYFVLRVWIVDRQGLALVTLHFGAEPPSAPGAPATCRVCSGPLPSAAKTLFVRCAYCGSDNVLGLDVRGDASRETAQGTSLAAALASRARDRLVFGCAAALAVAVLAGDVHLLRPLATSVHGWMHCWHRGPGCGTPLEPLDDRCATGDAPACAQVLAQVDDIVPGWTHGSSDPLRALEQACAHGVAAACVAAAHHYIDPPVDPPPRASELLVHACDLKDAAGCTEAGEVAEGRLEDAQRLVGPFPDVQRSQQALDLFARACTAGSAPGCLDEATYGRLGKAGVAIDPARTRALDATACRLAGTAPAAAPSAGCALLACDDGQLARCVDASQAYQKGRGVRADAELEEALDRRACDAGVLAGCSDLGWLIENGVTGAFPDQATAETLYHRACDGGDGEGCYRLGVIEHLGEGHAKDDKAALTLFAHGCDLGAPDACASLAELTDQGQGTAKDPAKATSDWARACQLGDPQECANLGIRYRDGLGVPRDAGEAVRRFHASCEAGYVRGCALEGLADAKAGKTTEALALYERACAADDGLGCYELGVADKDRDPLASRHALRKSCRLGIQDACP